MLTNDKNLVKNIKATMEMEGFHVQDEDISLINMYLNNEITEDQGVDIIKKDIISKMNDKNV